VAELGLGDGVAGWRILVSVSCACGRRISLPNLSASVCSRLLRAVLALEGLVGHALAELLDTVDLLGLEAVQGLLLLVSACVRECNWVIEKVGAPSGRVWAA
jgi:hypothetical protein